MQTNSKTIASRKTRRDQLLELTNRVLRPRRAVTPPAPDQVRNIVVIKPCCLGDMLMATPVLRALSRHFPEAEITIVTDDWTRHAIETNPRISNLILYPTGGGARVAMQVAQRMRPFRFDLGISLDRSPVTALALWLARIPIRAGINSQSRGLGLHFHTEPQPRQHESELYLSTLEPLGITNATLHPEFVVPDDAMQRVNEIVPPQSDRRIVVIHPGGAVNPGVAMLEKRWPATNFGELAALLSAEAGASIVLVGANSDRDAVDTVRRFANTPVIDLCGRLSLAELGALCKKAALYVGNDSGVTHLASAVGAPVVAIFGPTSPNQYRPLGRRTRVCASEESWALKGTADLRTVPRSALPDIVDVPLPQVFNACLELLGETR